MIKSVTYYLTAAANTSVQDFLLNTPDDYQARTIKGIYSGTTQTTSSVFVKNQGKQVEQIDIDTLSKLTEGFHVDVMFPAQILFGISLQDISGSGFTNWPVTVKYETAAM